ncbi:hypothetical protein R1sor_018869 [Riccia sorocarpa]|uniref:Uncharacterized protein n=1 Tax=Riccia sorocarpa TaxID=122646 RepID=A0ABD3IB25_9MARC
MVNYTNRMMTAIESAMGHEIAWPDRQERAVNSAAVAGFSWLYRAGRWLFATRTSALYIFSLECLVAATT